MQPSPGRGPGGAVPGGRGAGGRGRGGPGSLIGEPERGAVPQRAAVGAGQPGRGREVHHPVAAQPAEHFGRQVAQQPGQPGQVIAGVEDDHDVRVAVVPVPGGDDPPDDLADLRRGHLGGVIGRAEPDRVQRQRPGGPAWFQRGDDRVRPARDQLRVALAPRIAVAEQPVRAGGRVWPQPVADVGGQPDPAVIPARQRQRGQRPAQPRDADLAGVDRVIDRAVAAAALRLQRQLRQHVHPARPAQHRVRQLEQRIPAPAQAPVHLSAERRQQLARQILPVLARTILQRHTESHGHRHHRQVPSTRTDGGAVAARCHHDTPDNTSKTPDQKPKGLNNKLRACLET